MRLNGSIISNSSELSNAFKDHFSTIGPCLANDIPPNDNNNNDLSYINNLNVDHYKFSFSSTSSSTVYKLCRSKATGLDNISAKIIRECADLISVSRGTQRQFSENICSEDDLRSRIFGTFVVKISCLPASPTIFEHLKNGIIAHFYRIFTLKRSPRIFGSLFSGSNFRKGKF